MIPRPDAPMKRLLRTALALLVITPIATAQEKPASKPKLERDDAIRLQIFLDQSHFGPGVIDGKPGLFTSLAVAAWNEVNGHPTDDWSAVVDAARKTIKHPLATALVPECAKDWVDTDLPTDRALQAKKKRMSYRHMVEFMAERYHCDEQLLRELNGDKLINRLKPRDSILVPNITPFRIEDIAGNHYGSDPELSERHVVVDTKVNQVRIYRPAPAALVIAKPDDRPAVSPAALRNSGLIASFPITPGQSKFIHKGVWELRNMVELPWWKYDQSFLDTGTRSDKEQTLNIPPGPNSPVGIIWNGTSRSGIGLHGTSDPETIGRARSAGCIRLCNWDAIRLPQFIRPGASIEIR